MQHDEETGLPVRAALHPTGLYVALRPIDRAQLQDAFMQETVARVQAPERVVQIPRELIGRPPRGTAPAGIVFHVARCGSTLISQSLKRLDDVVVYAEPQPVNELLAPPHRWSASDVAAALNSLGAIFSRHARGPYILKLSSWNTLYCDVVAAAFPQTPWILSVRDPVEVGVSLLASPPGWFSAGNDTGRGLTARVDPHGTSTSREELVAKVYGAFCNAASRLDARRGRIVPYEALPSAICDMVAPHFSLPVSDRQRDQIAAAARGHAKAAVGKTSAFVSDVAAKQQSASAALRRAVDSFARPELDRLMQLHAATIAR
ncbi:hypothetical protein [Povalibacter sp.]|uniref:hypothetical protein n=1 Tax=Povalibacter sp. TaxID=1962978 RepID=UPI002F419760